MTQLIVDALELIHFKDLVSAAYDHCLVQVINDTLLVHFVIQKITPFLFHYLFLFICFLSFVLFMVLGSKDWTGVTSPSLDW